VRLTAAAFLALCLGLAACETGHDVAITNRCAAPVWVRYGRQPTEVPTEIRPGETRRFGVINDGRVFISATKDEIRSSAGSGVEVGRSLVLSGQLCPKSN
jgi:hypothetical protein